MAKAGGRKSLAQKTLAPRKHKKMLSKSAAQVREYALQLEAIARRMHRVADDMDGAGVTELAFIPQGIETARNNLADRVEVELEQRLRKVIKQKGRRDAEHA